MSDDERIAALERDLVSQWASNHDERCGNMNIQKHYEAWQANEAWRAGSSLRDCWWLPPDTLRGVPFQRARDWQLRRPKTEPPDPSVVSFVVSESEANRVTDD